VRGILKPTAREGADRSMGKQLQFGTTTLELGLPLDPDQGRFRAGQPINNRDQSVKLNLVRKIKEGHPDGRRV